MGLSGPVERIPKSKSTQRIESVSEPTRNEKTAVAQAAKAAGSNRQYVADAKVIREKAPELLEQVK